MLGQSLFLRKLLFYYFYVCMCSIIIIIIITYLGKSESSRIYIFYKVTWVVSS